MYATDVTERGPWLRLLFSDAQLECFMIFSPSMLNRGESREEVDILSCFG
jgi:hypothetical protein